MQKETFVENLKRKNICQENSDKLTNIPKYQTLCWIKHIIG